MADGQDLVIDQTLYWKVFDRADEAWFCVAMLGSHAMTEAITPFNPKGAFGERHIHALPYRLMPAFDPANEDHLRVGAERKMLAQERVGGGVLDKRGNGRWDHGREQIRSADGSSPRVVGIDSLLISILAAPPHQGIRLLNES